MSKIGKQPIEVREGVKVEIENDGILVKGPKGELKLNFPRGISALQEGDKLLIKSADKTKQGRSNFGSIRAIAQNMVTGVVDGWQKKLELVGTGYRSETDGKTLTLTVGFSHPVKYEAPEGIVFKVEKNIISIDGADRQLVGKVASEIRLIRPPEPYKGKGIKYVDEVIRRKAGKAAKAAGAA